MYDLITAKQAIRDLFPQLKKYDFKIWQSSELQGNKVYLQCYKNNEFYGNMYIVDLDKKILTN